VSSSHNIIIIARNMLN